MLSRVLDEEDNTQLIATAVRALGNTDQASAVDPVMNAYRTYSDPTVRNSAVRALRRLDEHPVAIEAMLEILEDRLAQETGDDNQ